MLNTISISTKSRTELCDITKKVLDVIKTSKVRSGTCQIFIPHTTAGIAINESADPSVVRDVIKGLEAMVPADRDYEHSEDNADAHIKSILVGTDKTIFIEAGKLRLGTWQGIFFCEFDGPRQRQVLIKITETK